MVVLQAKAPRDANMLGLYPLAMLHRKVVNQETGKDWKEAVESKQIERGDGCIQRSRRARWPTR